MSAQININFISIQTTVPDIHIKISLRSEYINFTCWYMVQKTWKVEVIFLSIFKLVDGCSNLYDLFDFSNILK